MRTLADRFLHRRRHRYRREVGTRITKRVSSRGNRYFYEFLFFFSYFYNAIISARVRRQRKRNRSSSLPTGRAAVATARESRVSTLVGRQKNTRNNGKRPEKTANHGRFVIFIIITINIIIIITIHPVDYETYDLYIYQFSSPLTRRYFSAAIVLMVVGFIDVRRAGGGRSAGPLSGFHRDGFTCLVPGRRRNTVTTRQAIAPETSGKLNPPRHHDRSGRR